MLDWFKRNRAAIGLGLLAMIGVAQADQEVRSHPRISLALACLSAYITAAGAHRSDEYQRDHQEKQ